MTRVIHTGDTYLGYQQCHSSERQQDFLGALEWVVVDTLDGDVDTVVRAGDLYHDHRPELPDLLGTFVALRRLDDAGIPFLVIVGNHESTHGGQRLDPLECLGLTMRLRCDPYIAGDVVLYGLGYMLHSCHDELDYQFDPVDADRTVLVAHGLFTPFVHADWETRAVLTESNVDSDAVLLDDNHIPDTVGLDGTWVTHCGSTERANASERDPRGYSLVEFTPDAVDIRRRTFETRPFAFVEIDLADDGGIERVRQHICEFDLKDVVVIVELRGEDETITPVAVESFVVEEGVLITRVNDKRNIGGDGDLATDVTFVDPDDAAREWVRKMGLSSTALGMDETVRTSKVVNSNAHDEARERVKPLLSDDPDAFIAAERESDAEAGGSESIKDTANGGDAAIVGGTAKTAAEAATDTNTKTAADTDSKATMDPAVSRDSSLSDFV